MPESPPPTVAEYARRWLQRRRTIHAHTRAAYRNAVERWIVPSLGAASIATVSRAELRDAIQSWALDPGTIRASLPPLHGALEDAIEEGLRPDDPLRNLHKRIFGKRSRWQPHADRAFREPELVRFFRHAPDVCPPLVDYWLLLHRSGIRPGEGLAARWDALELDAAQLRVMQTYSQSHIGPPKFDSRRWVDLSSDVVAALRHRLARGVTSPWIFPSPKLRGRPCSYRYMLDRFHEIAATAQLGGRGFTPHALRHTYATWLAEEERVPPRYLQDSLGHASLVTTEVYTRGARVPNRGYVEALDRRMRRPALAIVPGGPHRIRESG